MTGASSLRLTLTRLMALVVKEITVVLRDKRARTTLIISPLLQLILFGLATTLEVRDVRFGFVSQDAGVAAERLVERIAASPQFGAVVRYPSTEALARAVDRQDVIGGIAIDDRYSRTLAMGGEARVWLLLDGRRSNAAQITAAYIDAIARAEGATLARAAPPRVRADVAVTHWFNPNLIYLWFTMPSLIAVITCILATSVAAQSVAREREYGTIEQLVVLPLKPWQILLAKLVPGWLAGMANATFFIVMIPIVYGVPLTGSLVLLYLALAAYVLTLVSVGLVISLASRNQQQAFLGMYLFTVPAVLLSGYASPVENTPDWLQVLTLADPTRHFLVIVEGLFLKEMPTHQVLANIPPMLALAAVALAIAMVLSQRRFGSAAA